MKRIVLLLSVMFFAINLQAQTQTNLISNVIQPTSHVDGTSITWTTHKWTVPTNTWGKAIELRKSATEGYVGVHLVSDGASSIYKMPVTAGERTSAMFDWIDSATTTVSKDSITVFLTK